MPQNKPINPFYVALLPVGALFALTACAYTVVTVQALQPGASLQSPFAHFLNRHGLVVIGIELLVLGVFTTLAIATDDYWTRPLERHAEEPPPAGEQP